MELTRSQEPLCQETVPLMTWHHRKQAPVYKYFGMPHPCWNWCPVSCSHLTVKLSKCLLEKNHIKPYKLSILYPSWISNYASKLSLVRSSHARLEKKKKIPPIGHIILPPCLNIWGSLYLEPPSVCPPSPCLAVKSSSPLVPVPGLTLTSRVTL